MPRRIHNLLIGGGSLLELFPPPATMPLADLRPPHPDELIRSSWLKVGAAFEEAFDGEQARQEAQPAGDSTGSRLAAGV